MLRRCQRERAQERNGQGGAKAVHGV